MERPENNPAEPEDPVAPPNYTPPPIPDPVRPAPPIPYPMHHTATTADNTLGGLIPTKNSNALIAYYLGVFSIIPCFGPLLGIAAFILGLKGLRFAKEHPEAKGKTHAWVGIVAGGFFGLLYLLLLLLGIGSALLTGSG